MIERDGFFYPILIRIMDTFIPHFILDNNEKTTRTTGGQRLADVRLFFLLSFPWAGTGFEIE